MKNDLIMSSLVVAVLLQSMVGVVAGISVGVHCKALNDVLQQQNAVQSWTHDVQTEQHVAVMQQLDRLLCDNTKDDLAQKDR